MRKLSILSRVKKWIPSINIDTILRLIITHEDLKSWFKEHHKEPGLQFDSTKASGYLLSEINDLK